MPKRHRSSMDQAAAEIRSRILDLRLMPGEKLDDIGLAEDIGLSRTPVREALFQLSSEGLIEVGLRGGFTVRGLELVDIRELFEAHQVLARCVSRLVAVRATPEDLDRLAAASLAVDRAVESEDPGDIASTNALLHRLEAEIARNGYLEMLAGRVHGLGQRLSYLSFGGKGLAEEGLKAHYQKACHDHADSLEAYRRRDADTAEKIAARHVALFRGRIMDFLASGALDGVSLDSLAVEGD
ncbi:GntR family transcriptional regulator [Arthrobacter sp. UYEF20]|uniref:GntR family transcriptional regulator n=1 Tax=Arthrobacter sp. UYEF20 TaxID=1756363 RepID=UPI003399EB22